MHTHSLLLPVDHSGNNTKQIRNPTKQYSKEPKRNIYSKKCMKPKWVLDGLEWVNMKFIGTRETRGQRFKAVNVSHLSNQVLWLIRLDGGIFILALKCMARFAFESYTFCSRLVFSIHFNELIVSVTIGSNTWIFEEIFKSNKWIETKHKCKYNIYKMRTKTQRPFLQIDSENVSFVLILCIEFHVVNFSFYPWFSASHIYFNSSALRRHGVMKLTKLFYKSAYNPNNFQIKEEKTHAIQSK